MLAANLEAQRVATALLEGCMVLAYQLLMRCQRFLLSPLLNMNHRCFKERVSIVDLPEIAILSTQNHDSLGEVKFYPHQTNPLKPSMGYNNKCGCYAFSYIPSL